MGYADGSGGLQQVFTDTFLSGQVYTFSVWIGYRSDEVNSAQGTGAITIGAFDAGASTFTPLSTQTVTVRRGDFDFVAGSYLPTGGVLGFPIAIQLTSVGSFQVLFDQPHLSFAAIPESGTRAGVFGAVALVVACWRRRIRPGPADPTADFFSRARTRLHRFRGP